jgi:hypothetical protein
MKTKRKVDTTQLLSIHVMLLADHVSNTLTATARRRTDNATGYLANIWKLADKADRTWPDCSYRSTMLRIARRAFNTSTRASQHADGGPSPEPPVTIKALNSSPT